MKPEHISILLESAKAFVNAVTSRPFEHELNDYAMDIRVLTDAIKCVESGFTDPTILLILCRSADMPYTIPDDESSVGWIETRNNAIISTITALDFVTIPSFTVNDSCLRVVWESFIEASSWQEEFTGPIRTIAQYYIKASETRLKLFRTRQGRV